MLEQTSCIVCGANRPEYLYSSFDRLCGTPGKFDIVTCSVCGFVYLNPRPPENDSIKLYPRQYYSFLKWNEEVNFVRAFYRKIKWRALSRFNLTRFPGVPKFMEKGRILDFGCGSGEILGILKRVGWETYGIEINNEAAEYARSRDLKVYSQELKSIGFPDGHFDVIRISSVLEHLYDAPQILKEFHRILKNEGQLLVICPNFESFSSRLFKERWFHLDAPRHLYHFTPKSLSRFLNDHRFQIISIRSCGSGGILGSVDYLLNEKKNKYGTNLFDIGILRYIIYFAFEMWVNRLKAGDLIEAKAKKT
jgi:SAM-dependent methyltransferase